MPNRKNSESEFLLEGRFDTLEVPSLSKHGLSMKIHLIRGSILLQEFNDASPPPESSAKRDARMDVDRGGV